MYKIFDAIWTTINNPKALTERFAASLAAYGAAVSQNKTVAVYVDPYNAAVVSLPVVNIVNAVSYPESEHFLICGIRAFQGAGAALGSVAWTAGISDAIGQNGSFQVNNNGSIELKNVPLTAFQPGSGYPDSGLFILEKPIFWKAQSQLTITLSFPTVPSTTNLAMRFELMGIKLI
jgi:hypothetical protein